MAFRVAADDKLCACGADERVIMLTTQQLAGLGQSITGSPLGAAALTGAALWGGSRLLYPTITGAIGAYARKAGIASAAGDDQMQEFEQEMADKKSPYYKWIPIGLGALGAAGVLGATADTRSIGNFFRGMTTWDRFPKQASVSYNWNTNDQRSVPFEKMIPVRSTKQMVLSDPYLQVYQKGDIVSVINDATKPADTGVRLGKIFDSALNRIEDDLSLRGLTNAVTRSVAGYGMAKVLTGAIGNMMELSPSTREKVQDAGMFANVIGGIFSD